MGLSDKLAKQILIALLHSVHRKKKSVFAFDGVRTGLDATSLDDSDLEFAQMRLRILSGYMDF